MPALVRLWGTACRPLGRATSRSRTAQRPTANATAAAAEVLPGSATSCGGCSRRRGPRSSPASAPGSSTTSRTRAWCADATIHLVDWLPGIVDAGIARSIIARDDDGAPDCVYCHLADERARTYCRHFRKPREPSAKVCENFVANPDDPPTCTAFERGDCPVCHREDVTEGYASAFAENVVDALRELRSWRQALAQANALAKRIRRHRTSLGIDAASVDLTTSSMVVSQFEHEPCEYFSRRVADMLGPPTQNEERRLGPAMETLRTTLLSNQIEGHCDEIARILAPGGRCLMSFELFHLNRETGRWFLVDEMYGA